MILNQLISVLSIISVFGLSVKKKSKFSETLKIIYLSVNKQFVFIVQNSRLNFNDIDSFLSR